MTPRKPIGLTRGRAEARAYFNQISGQLPLPTEEPATPVEPAPDFVPLAGQRSQLEFLGGRVVVTPVTGHMEFGTMIDQLQDGHGTPLLAEILPFIAAIKDNYDRQTNPRKGEQHG